MHRQRSVHDTVAWLRAAGGSTGLAGAAFLISPNLALTCAHVVRDHLGLENPTPRQRPTGTISLQFQGLRAAVDAKVAPSGWWPGGDDDEIEDIAVLEVPSPLEELRFAALAAFPPSEHLDCEIFGASGGYQTVGQTVYAQLAGKPDWRGWRQLDARPSQQSSYFVIQGFSGSPVLDSLGNIIWGMVDTVETAPGKLIAFAITADDLRAATDAVLQAARTRREKLDPPKQQAPGPLDQLAREALAVLLGGEMDVEAPAGEIEPERLETLRGAVRDLAERARRPAEAPSIAKALASLQRGEKGDAEAVFAGVIERKRAEGTAAYLEAAEAARHLGALAYLDDTKKAIEAYSTATRLDPDDTWSWIFLGRLYPRAGNLVAAEQALREAREAADRADIEGDIMVADSGLGDVRIARGDLAGAVAAYEAALAVAEKLAAQDPSNSEWQRDLSVSFDRIGDVQSARGNLEAALKAY
jgi:tetratricopeptide (TPR) repeat protein